MIKGEGERTIVRSHRGMVMCPHAIASAAGAQILQQGGSAVDAAIAVQAALGVVYPHITGLGGDAFWLIYDAQTQQLQGLNGSGRAAQGATIAAYRDRGLSAIPPRGPLAANTVPGAVASWAAAHQHYHRLPWAAVLAPAIVLAQEGYPVTGSQVYWTRRDRPDFEAHSPTDCPFLPNRAVPEPGTRLTNPDLGRTLATLAADGPEAFYHGDLADRICAHLQALGGLLTREDFARHRADWVLPLTTTYRGKTLCELPPNSQGFTVLQAMNVLEGIDLRGLGHGTVAYYHYLIEATKLAFADRDRWLSDPDFIDIPIAMLISKAYGDRQRARLHPTQAQAIPTGAIGGDTVYTAVVDRAGNAVSVIQSLYFDFGAAVVIPKTGLVLQNRGSFFSLDPTHANALAPGKRPFHTLMPAMVLGDRGTPELVLGTMGGEGQPQTQLALLTRVLDFGFDPQRAIDLPRWLWGRTWGAATTGLTMEGRIPAAVRDQLGAWGHVVTPAPDWSEQMGHAHMIRIDPATGEYQGGCDPRSDGAAIAL